MNSLKYLILSCCLLSTVLLSSVPAKKGLVRDWIHSKLVAKREARVQGLPKPSDVADPTKEQVDPSLCTRTNSFETNLRFLNEESDRMSAAWAYEQVASPEGLKAIRNSETTKQNLRRVLELKQTHHNFNQGWFNAAMKRCIASYNRIRMGENKLKEIYLDQFRDLQKAAGSLRESSAEMLKVYSIREILDIQL